MLLFFILYFTYKFICWIFLQCYGNNEPGEGGSPQRNRLIKDDLTVTPGPSLTDLILKVVPVHDGSIDWWEGGGGGGVRGGFVLLLPFL